MGTILNLAAYHFVPLTDLPEWRQRLWDSASAAQLKGTVLLAEEGINLFVAGPEAPVRQWWRELAALPGLAPLKAKESWSDAVPFKHLRVKIKREIIRMNQPAIAPVGGRAPAVSATTLQRWLQQGHDDDGRPVLTLDTRNRFEVDAGRFSGALDWDLQKFSDFPQALAAHAEALQHHTVVSYCTGGIRCEKAALLMQQAGLRHAFQLDGGILQYFEDCPGAPHWDGDCVVFDERGAVNASLQPSAAKR